MWIDVSSNMKNQNYKNKTTKLTLKHLKDSLGDNVCLLEEYAVIKDYAYGDGDSIRQNEIYITEGTRVFVYLYGSATIEVNLQDYRIGPRSVIVVPDHSIFIVKEMESGVLHAIITEEINITDFICVSLEKESFSILMNLFEILWNTENGRRFNVFRRTTINSIFDYILAHKNIDRSIHASIYARFIELALKNAETNRDIRFYSNLLNITPAYLEKMVYKQTGTTPLLLLHQIEIKIAEYYLLKTDLLIDEISCRLNHSTPSNFSKFFKHIKGITPREYRKAHNKMVNK